jgi:hypothetical protein
MYCWDNSARHNAAQHMEAIFKKMKDRFLRGDKRLLPDRSLYGLVLKTYARQMRLEEAEKMLWAMVDDLLAGNAAAEPNPSKWDVSLR